MLSIVKPQIEKYFDPLAKLLSHVNPNVLTLIGSIPPLLFFVFVVNKWYVLALFAFVGGLFDFLDGMVARRENKVTDFGGFLDSTMDRVSDFFIITAFAFGGIVRWEIVTTLLFLSLLISYIRAQGGVRSGGKASFALGVGLIERPERLVVVILSLILYMRFPQFNYYNFNIAECSFLILIFLSLLTVIQRISHTYTADNISTK